MTGLICTLILTGLAFTNAVAKEPSIKARAFKSKGVGGEIGQPPSPPAGWTDGYVMANGIRIHY